MTPQSIVIIGLPASGKTTFLAALWHLVTARDIDTALRFERLTEGDSKHLNAIAARWRDAKVQDRTLLAGMRRVSMNLKDKNNASITVTFPDVPGEAYRKMWEDRECDLDLADLIKGGNIMLLIHADTIRVPRWVADDAAQSLALGLPVIKGEPVPWHPRLAPTQVQIVDLLQLLRVAPLDSGPRKLAILLSAWDKAEPEGKSPRGYLEEKLPLLAQYIRQNADGWDIRCYGLSAQGGDYDPTDEDAPRKPDAARLRDLDQASSRIALVNEANKTHDLTEPLEWLMQ